MTRNQFELLEVGDIVQGISTPILSITEKMLAPSDGFLFNTKYVYSGKDDCDKNYYIFAPGYWSLIESNHKVCI